MDGSLTKGKGMLVLEVGFVEAAALACTVDTYDTEREREVRQEILIEANAGVVATRYSIL